MNKLLSACRSMLRIGLIGFGGGSALIPVFQKDVVEDEALVSSDELEEDIVIASITPGALPVEIAGGLGKRLGGRPGMFLCAAAMSLPGVFLTVALLSLFPALSGTAERCIRFLTVGITAFIASLLTEYVLETARRVRERPQGKRGRMLLVWAVILGVFLVTCGKNFYRVLGLQQESVFSIGTAQVFAAAFFVIFFTNGRPNRINLPIAAAVTLLYLLCAGSNPVIDSQIVMFLVAAVMIVLSLFGLIRGMRQANEHSGLDAKDLLRDLLASVLVMAAAVLLGALISGRSAVFTLRGILSSLMSFGGGDAYLTVADGLFVQSGLLSEDSFYSQLIPIVNILPGSILCKTLSGIGWLLGVEETGSAAGGLVLALVGFLCATAASCGVFAVIGDIYKSFRRFPVFQTLRVWIRPIVSGLMMSVILSLLYQCLKYGNALELGYRLCGVFALVFALDLFLGRRGLGGVKRLLFSAGAGFVLGWITVLTV